MDLETAFSEINGLMAGLSYQDKAEPCKAPVASPSSLSQNSSGVAAHAHLSNTSQYPTEITIENNPPTAGGPVPGTEHQPMASHWAAIRNLREETAFHHERFQQLCRDLGDPTVSKLLEIYPDAQSIRNKGAQLVKDVLEGFRPRELSLVFAFASFAYAISQLLYKNDRIDRSEILADLNVWRSLISDPRERQTFDLVAQNLWPEAKDHVHFIPVPAPNRDVPFPDLPSSAVRLPESAIPDFSYFPAQGQGAGGQSTGLYPTDHFGFGNAASYTGREYVISPDTVGDYANFLMNASNEAFNYAFFNALSNEVFRQEPSGSGWTQPNGIDGPGSPRPRGETDGVFGGGREQLQPIKPVPQEMKLADTAMFLVVLLFLQDIAELVYILSGRSLPSRRYKLYKAEETDQEDFYRSVREEFFKPRYRRQNFKTPAFLALLSVAEKLTEGGLLRSIAEIKHYLVSVAAVSKAFGPSNRPAPTVSNAMINKFSGRPSTRRSL